MALRKAYGWEETDEMGPPEVEQDYTPLGELDAPELMPEDVNPLKALDPDAVPPELKFDPRRELADILRRNPAPGPDPRVAKAMALDRKRQNEAEVREYLLAAGQRRAPNIRNLGSPETQLALSQKPQDPMSRELMAMKLLEARRGLEPKATSARDQAYINYMRALTEKANRPPAEKPPEKPGEVVSQELADTYAKATGGDYSGWVGKPLSQFKVAMGAKKPGGKSPATPKPLNLSAEKVEELAGYDTAISAMEDVGRKFDERNMGSMLNSAGKFVRGSDAQAFEAEMRVVRQVVGKILEGGKLQAADEQKYREMMPAPGESPRVAATKVQSLVTMLRRDKENRLKALKDYGYRMPGESRTTGQPQMRLLPNGDIEVLD